MPFERPSLTELIDQGATEIESRLPGLLVRVRRSLVGVLNRIVAGALWALYRYAEYLNRQAWPDTCDPEFLPGHGARWKVPRKPAFPASGSITIAGDNGTTVLAGTTWQRADGALYAADADVEIAGGSAVVAVTAVEPGQAGNASIGVALTLSSPIGGVVANAIASTALAGGADIEQPEAYRARILARIQETPQGGAELDYKAWTLQVPGVTRSWVYPAEQGAGSVVVRFVRDDDPSIIPDAGEVAAVQSHLDQVRPVTSQVYAVAPISTPLDFTLSVTPNTAAVKAAVAAELAAMIKRDAVPGGKLLISKIREAASIAAGENNHVFTSPTADVVYGTGELAEMGVITWL